MFLLLVGRVENIMNLRLDLDMEIKKFLELKQNKIKLLL
jgi:hypothetical protein